MLLAVVVGFATGILDELWQAHVPGRASDAMDFLADSSGVVTGQFVYALWRAMRQRGRNAE